jgi:hypothetical protein
MFAGRPVPTGLSNTSASSLPTKGGSPPCTLNGSQILHPLACILHLTFSTVHRQSSVLNLPSFHSSILPTAELILQKVNSNNNSKQFTQPHFPPLFAPDSGLREAKKAGLNAICFELIWNNSPPPATTEPILHAPHSCPRTTKSSTNHPRSIVHSQFQNPNLPAFHPSILPLANQRNHSSQRFSGSIASTLTTEYPAATTKEPLSCQPTWPG